MPDAPIWSEEGLMEYIFMVGVMILEAIGVAAAELVEAFWNAFIIYVGMEGAFWISLILIAIGSVYVIVWRFVL